jgi:LacI family transcriptional regulator
MPPEPRVPLRQIAERTGLSRMAVSLALRNRPGVSPSTRQRVLKAAEALGYAPDPELSKMLARIRMRAPAETKACLALLTSGSVPGEWKRLPTERKYVEGARARARAYGYNLEEFWMTAPGMSPGRLGKILWHRGIEGLVIAPLQGNVAESRRTLEFDFGPFAAVEISETVEAPDLFRAIHDQYTSMQKVLEALAGLGYGRVGLVLERALDERVNGRWTAAYLGHRFRAGEDGMPPLLMGSASQREFDRWFDRHRPDAVVSVDQFGARLLDGRGAKVPGEVGYATLDLDGDSAARPGLSGIDQNSEQVGAAAIDLLIAAIQRGERGVPRHPQRVEIEGTWRAGNTTRARRRAGRRVFT